MSWRVVLDSPKISEIFLQANSRMRAVLLHGGVEYCAEPFVSVQKYPDARGATTKVSLAQSTLLLHQTRRREIHLPILLQLENPLQHQKHPTRYTRPKNADTNNRTLDKILQAGRSIDHETHHDQRRVTITNARRVVLPQCKRKLGRNDESRRWRDIKIRQRSPLPCAEKSIQSTYLSQQQLDRGMKQGWGDIER